MPGSVRDLINMKYTTETIRVKEIVNFIGNLEADGYRGDDWNPSNVFDIHSMNVISDKGKCLERSIWVSVIYGSCSTRAICVMIDDIIRVFGKIDHKDKPYVQRVFNQAYNTNKSSDIDLKEVGTWLNDTIDTLESYE